MPNGYAAQVVSAAERVGRRQDLAAGDRRQVLRRDAADVELAGLQRRVLGGVVGVRVVGEARELRLRAAGVGGVRHERGDRAGGGGAEAGQLPRAVDDAPERVGRVGLRVLGLRGQVVEHRGALGPLVGGRVGGAAAAAGRRAGRGDVPGRRHRGDLGELVVGEPDAGDRGLEVQHHRVGAGGAVGGQVVGQQAGHVAVVVGRLGLHHVEPEDHVAGVNGLAVAPLPALHRHRDGLAVGGVRGGVRERERVVHRDRGAVVAEHVQRPVHEHLEALGVVLVRVGQRHVRPDVVQRHARRQRHRRGAARHRRGRRGRGRRRASSLPAGWTSCCTRRCPPLAGLPLRPRRPALCASAVCSETSNALLGCAVCAPTGPGRARSPALTCPERKLVPLRT